MTPCDPPILSIDTETYGAVKTTIDGRPLPEQNHFHPARCLWQDKVTTKDLVQVITITLPAFDPRPTPQTPWTMSLISQLRPGVTMALYPSNALHMRIFRAFLKHADTLFGMNFLFDIPILRAIPEVSPLLGGRHTLIDLSHLNYLHNELRPEKSLKALGPVLQQFTYKKTLKDENGEFRRFNKITDKDALEYACQDPHNTMLAAAEIAARIHQDFPTSAKNQPAVLSYYSALTWASVRMMEAGIPMSIDALLRVEAALSKESAEASEACNLAGLLVGGEGCVASKLSFMEPLALQLPPSYANGLEYTKKKRLSLNDKNRLLVTDYFESEIPDSPALPILQHWDTYTKNEKILSSYLSPLLRGPRKQPNDPALAKLREHSCPNISCVSSSSPSQPASLSDSSKTKTETKARPTRLRLGLGFPRIYVTPSPFKDGQGDAGGQQQCRISFKDPAVQTFPKSIKECIASRYGRDGVILSWDASQVELRVAGLISGDSFILDAYRQKRDLHRETAIKTFGPTCLEDPNFDSKFRQPAKHANFTKLNLGGAAVLQKTLLKKAKIRVPLSFCEMMIAETPRVNPELYAWQHRIIREARAAGRIELPILGQSRFFSPDEKPNEIVNFPIQGLAATLTNYVMIRVHETMPSLNARKPRWHLFVNWYDAIFADAHVSVVPEAKAVVEAAIQHTIKTYWAELEKHYGRTCPMEYGFTLHPYKDPFA